MTYVFVQCSRGSMGRPESQGLMGCPEASALKALLWVGVVGGMS